MPVRHRVDIAIVGAGAAGLAAAVELSRSGTTVVLLEARTRLGGRIWTRRAAGWPIPLELGAEFVHGRNASFFALLRDHGLSAIRLPDAHVRRVGTRLMPMTDTWDRFDAITRRLGGPGPDRSVAEVLRRRPKAFSSKERRLLKSMVEGYDAAPVELVSARSLSTAGEPRMDDEDRAQFRLTQGYGYLVDALHSSLDADRFKLFRSTVVERIAWKAGRVQLATSRGTFQAGRALITVPIGVLRAPAGTPGAIVFDPDPPAIRRAVAGLAMGDVVRLVMRFREPFWREAPRVKQAREPEPNFFHLFSEEFPTWWTAAPVEEPILTGWTGGSAAASLRRLSKRDIVGRALEVFGAGVGLKASRIARLLLDWKLHDWTADPYARGAYAYALVGGATAGRRLMTPVQRTLYFAGEAIGEGDSGTVPAAIASGRRAARQMLE